MVKRVKRLMIAASLLMLLSACGKAEADLPGTETAVQVQEEQTQEDLEDPSAMGKEETTGQEEEGTAKAGEDSETSAIIADNKRSDEDVVMFSKFWPKFIVKILVKFYAKGQDSNNM